MLLGPTALRDMVKNFWLVSLTVELLLVEKLIDGLLAVVEGVEGGEQRVEEGVGVDVVGVEDLEDVHLILVGFKFEFSRELIGKLEI